MSEDNIAQPDNKSETVTGTFARLAPWTLGARMVVMGMAIIATAVLTRTMTDAEWNEYSLLKNIWWYIWLIGQLGLSEASLRFGAELAAQGEVGKFRRLLKKILTIQGLALALMLISFILMSGHLDKLFSVRFGFALIMTVILGAITIFKETLRQGYVAAYWIKLVALMSVIGATAFPVFSYLFIKVFGWGVAGGLAAEATGYGLMLLVFLIGLPWLKFKKTVADDVKPQPITNYRLFRYSGSIVSNHIMNLFLGPQIVIFLVQIYLVDVKEIAGIYNLYGLSFSCLSAVKGIAGIYNLAFELPKMGLSFFTLALVPLITAILTKAYYEDKSRLPEMLRSFYKLMTIMIMPLVFAGLLLLDKALIIMSGDKGISAGWLAVVLLPIQLKVILVLPIAAGLKVVEKQQRMIIPQLFAGIVGTGITAFILYSWPVFDSIVWAAYLRVLIVMPPFMYIAVRLVGGFYFPFRFVLRSALACLPMGVVLFLRPLWPDAEALAKTYLGAPIIGAIIMFVVSGAMLAIIYIVSARIFALFGPDEINYFRNAKVPGIKLLQKILVKKSHQIDLES